MKETHKRYKSKKLNMSYDKYPEENSSKASLFLAIIGTTRESPMYIYMSMFKHNKLSIGIKFICYKLKLGTSFSWGDQN